MDQLLSLSQPELAGFVDHVKCGFLTEADAGLAAELLGEGQTHLFSGWSAPDQDVEAKHAFLETLTTAHTSYPGGLPAYIRNARVLLADAAAAKNPFEGCTPEQPDLVDLSAFGPDYEAAENAGLAAFADTAVVLVAGGLGERLGYHGIKLDIPVEVTCGTSYLAHYAGVIREASRRLGRRIPLVIMTSRDTHAGTVATLEANADFGLAAGQITILRQELVPAVSDLDGHLAMDGPYHLVLKPHGHGDIHMLLHTTGTAKRLAAEGVRYILLIQDTNGQAFNSAFAAIGVSEREGYDFNSLAVNRVPGEAVGGLTRLVRPDGSRQTLNVEYNQLDPLLRATISPEGDVPDEHGFSLFPGNVNLIVIRLAPYLDVLERSHGIVAEFINPKFSDATRTAFKKPARLETMMQDLPKLFTAGEKVGVTVFDRSWCFSACKNNLADAAAKVAQSGPPESASSAENDFYGTGRRRLAMAGMSVVDGPSIDIRGIPFVTGPRVIVRPSTALTLGDLSGRLRGSSISGDATLLLDGDITLEDVEIESGAALVISAVPGARVVVRGLKVSSGPSFELVELSDGEMASDSVPEYLRIRGYRIVDHGAKRYEITEAGDWEIDASGSLAKAG